MRFDSFVRSKTLNRLDFRAHNIALCVINAVRRAILSEVPTSAFDFDICVPDAPSSGIKVTANTSTLHNEMLAHRFSFLPIHHTEDEQERVQIDPTRYQYSIRVKNKGSAGAQVIDVTSKDIRVMDALGAAVPSVLRDAMFPPDRTTGDHVLLVCLRPSPIGDGNGEEIAIDAISTTSVGRVNCRWSPVSLCSFRNVVDRALADAAYIALQAANRDAPTQTRAQFDTLEAHRCFARDEHGDPTSFDFSIESECGLRPEFIFFKALRILTERVKALAQAIARLPQDKGQSVTLLALPNADDFFALTISGEGHTLGNLLQGLLYETHVRDEASRRLSFVGYHVAHPLDQSICLKFKVTPGTQIREFLVEALEAIATRLDAIAVAWTQPSGLVDATIREVDAFLANITVDHVQ